MNRTMNLLAAALCLSLTFGALAEEHHHKATPKGGRLLAKTDPHAELVVEKDHSVTINFYNDEMKPIAAAGQTATVLAEGKDGKKRIEFEKKGDALVGKDKLPEGDGYNVVVQFRQTADAKPQNFRFKLDMETCGECKRAEYACICDH